MKRLLFVMLPILLAFAGCASTSGDGSYRQATAPTDYLSYPNDQAEVLVFFGYQCNPCHNFYSQELARWSATGADDVSIVYVPVIFSDAVYPAARAFHAAEVLGENPAFHAQLFDAYQSGVDLSSQKAVMAFARGCCDIDPVAFRTAYESELVERRMDQAETLLYQFGIRATPSVIVNREHLVDPSMVASGRSLLDTVKARLNGEAPGRLLSI
ncbi:MAG: thioredoxin domain-containing protein [Natronospirillum sp.]